MDTDSEPRQLRRGDESGADPREMTLTAGDGADDEKRLFSAGDGVGKKGVGRFVREIFLAGEEANERAALAACVIAQGAA